MIPERNSIPNVAAQRIDWPVLGGGSPNDLMPAAMSLLFSAFDWRRATRKPIGAFLEVSDVQRDKLGQARGEREAEQQQAAITLACEASLLAGDRGKHLVGGRGGLLDRRNCGPALFPWRVPTR
jgi:hypothetical protein